MNEQLNLSLQTLRPTEQQAFDAWRALVEAERRQVESIPDRPNPKDFYAPVAERFRDDPRRTDDPSLDLLRPLLQPDETWLDLGAGGGRYTLPVALGVQRVFAVDPSPGMLEVLRDSMQREKIDNVEIYEERWPGDSTAPQADVGFISHVGYDIIDIGPFIGQLEQHTRRLCVAMLYDRAPIMEYAPLWQPVHGEPRVTMPGMREFVALLFARGRHPELRFVHLPPRIYKDAEDLAASARRPLWVLPDTDPDRRLLQAARELAVPVPGGIALAPGGRHLGVVTWTPR